MPELKDAPPRTIEEIQENYLNGLVEQLSEDTSHEFAFGDRLLRKIVAEDRQPSFTESAYFQSKLGWDVPRINREIRRMTNVIRLQMVIGTASQRAELAKEKETATEIAEKEIGKLEQQIEKLSRQKNQLEKAASNATRRCAEVAEAMEKLRSPELLRADVFEAFNARKRHFGAGPLSRMNALSIEIRHRQICLNRPDDMTEQVWLDSIRMLAPKAVARNTESTFARYELTEHWPAAEADLLEEIEDMQNEVAVLELEKVAFDESQRLVADFYVEESK
jgi:hypothetical protein